MLLLLDSLRLLLDFFQLLRLNIGLPQNLLLDLVLLIPLLLLLLLLSQNLLLLLLQFLDDRLVFLSLRLQLFHLLFQPDLLSVVLLFQLLSFRVRGLQLRVSRR